MKRGDISNRTAPRLLFVWEGLIARCADPDVVERELRRRRPDWRDIVSQYHPEPRLQGRLYDLSWNQGYAVEAVTYLSTHAKKLVEEWVEYYRYPIARVTYDTPDGVGQRLLYEPDLIRVYDGEPLRCLMYGPRGQIVIDPAGDLL